jgi:hypothetical protein
MDGQVITQQGLRRLVEAAWEDVTRWFVAKPGVFALPRPEQQILFEYAERLRAGIRSLCVDPAWDRLYFDASSAGAGGDQLGQLAARRPPIYVDTRKLFGVTSPIREASSPDVAVAIHVLRSARATLELDDDGVPRHQTWVPVGIRIQGKLLEEQVAELAALAQGACDGYLFVVYSNEARRKSAVDLREVASWASWHQPGETLWWASRYFRAQGKV